jgi:hypothetical protein
MENKLHMQDETFANVLDDYTVRCIDSGMDTIIITGQPSVKFDGTTTRIKLTLHIEKVELTTILHPLASINERPGCGKCILTMDKFCQYRKEDGECTSEPDCGCRLKDE